MKLPIIKYGHPILRAKGKWIKYADERIQTLAADMLETMHEANGIGLAAQQVGAALQLTVLDISQVEGRPSTLRINGVEVDPVDAMPLILLNPRIELAKLIATESEGCLSFPDISAEIDRSISVLLEAETLEGEAILIEAEGLLARALQHEVDHLNGILFIDRMSSVAKASLSSRLKRLQKEMLKGKG